MAKVLIVEDEPDLREFVSLELKDAGHQTAEAGNGEEALALLVSYEPDIIVSDITMPVMNGYQFFRALKERHPKFAQTPFIFLSALADKDDVLKGYRLGADDYIAKPIDYDLLVARIDARVRQVTALGRSDDNVDQGAESVSMSDQPGEEAEALSKMGAMIEENNGQVLAAKLETISLEKIRKKYGERWKEVQEKILRNAEQVISHHLGETDVVHKTAAGDFVVSFANPDHEAAAAKVQTMKDEIWERLFGEIGDEAVAEVASEIHEIELSEHDVADGDGLFGRLCDKIKSASKILGRSREDSLQRIFEKEDMGFSPIVDGRGKTTRISTSAFTGEVNRKIGDLLAQGELSQELAKRLISVLLTRTMSRMKKGEKAPLIVPLHFSIANDGVREEIENFFRSFDKDIQDLIIVERVQLPNLFSAAGAAMNPFSIGRCIQALEVRRPAQVKGFDFRKKRVGFISIKFADLVSSYAGGMNTVIENFKEYGGRLYVKDVPTESMSEVQLYEPDLVSEKR